ncbi:MAG: N-acyl-D-glucosamine 2-epimerase [Chloroflexi bacterium]|nr:MAG: N-acyl-D-glucosamine 2-epimerase [Chloroflexota bacterium]
MHEISQTAVSPQQQSNLNQLHNEVKQELTTNILPFYRELLVDNERGGFYGRIDNKNQIYKSAAKGLVQHSRLLWTYAHAFRKLGDDENVRIANHACQFLLKNMWDEEHGGFYWFVGAAGRPFSSQKYIYGQAFAMYGLSEYALATENERALKTAVSLYHLLEKHAHDSEHGGYFDIFSQDWQQRLAENVDEMDAPVAKTMNTNLHVMEAYTNLLRVWPDKALQKSLRRLIRLHLDQIVNQETGHLRLHFTADWQSLHDGVSYGHDIEATWLMVEAAEVLGDDDLLAAVTAVSLKMAQIAYDEGIDVDGGLKDAPETAVKEWWPQAEALVGFFNAYQLTGQPHFLDAVQRCWAFVREKLVDKQHGEWFWGVQPDGTPLDKDKAGPWKTPYHNGRACLELILRINK